MNKILKYLIGSVLFLFLLSSNRRLIYTQKVSINKPLIEEQIPVFIMWGQSNMVGSTGVEALPSEYWTPNANAKIMGDMSSVFEVMDYSVHTWGNLHGAEWSLAKMFGNREIYIVKVSEGDTDLYNDWNKARDATNYNLLITAVNSAITQLSGKSNLSFRVIQGQYESDTNEEFEWLEYKDNMIAFIQNLESDTGIEIDSYFWYQVNKNCIAYTLYTGGYDYIYNVQAELYSNGVIDKIIKTNDLPLKDNVHFTSVGQIEIGKRIYYSLF